MASSGEKLTLSLPLLLVVLLLSGLHACLHVGAITIDDLYPFGADNGDTVILGGEDMSSGLIPLPYPVPVFGVTGVSGAYMNLKGAVHFRVASDNFAASAHVFPDPGDEYSMVAAYWTDLVADCRTCTGMAFRPVNDTNLLAGITSDIRSAFPNEALASGFTAESALIATWINVTLFELGTFPDAPIHTFQAVIAFNTRTVFVGLLYPDLTYQYYGDDAQGGFNLGDGVHSFRLPTSFSFAGASFDKLSNVGQTGKWWFGLDSISNATIGTFAYINEPSWVTACTQDVRLYGDGGVDACGNHRVMDWDFNNDGVFDDATHDSAPYINTDALRLTPGTHPIYARVSSPSPCPGSAPLVINTTLAVRGSTQPIITYFAADAASGNPKPYIGEPVLVDLTLYVNSCNDNVTTIDCGADSVEENGICRYSTTGVKTISVNITQNGKSASGSINITVVDYKQACTPAEFPPSGRAAGRRGCTKYQWTSRDYNCNYQRGIKLSTTLWAAFASRAPEDAAVIRRVYGNRTMEHAISYRRRNQAIVFAAEAAAALLNALTLPYAQCPSGVKLQFRHALYHGVNSAEARTVFKTFQRQNNRVDGCTLPLCT